MHLPIVWQWFPACKDFSVSLQASCKRRNQRQPRRCHTTAKRSTRMVCRALFRPRNTAKYRGIVKGAKPRSPASKSRGVSSQASGLRKAWASRATFGSGSSCYGSVSSSPPPHPNPIRRFSYWAVGDGVAAPAGGEGATLTTSMRFFQESPTRTVTHP